jgi:hypothetical protein
VTYLVYAVISNSNEELDTIWDTYNFALKRRDTLNRKAENPNSYRAQTVAVNTQEPKETT